MHTFWVSHSLESIRDLLSLFQRHDIAYWVCEGNAGLDGGSNEFQVHIETHLFSTALDLIYDASLQLEGYPLSISEDEVRAVDQVETYNSLAPILAFIACLLFIIAYFMMIM